MVGCTKLPRINGTKFENESGKNEGRTFCAWSQTIQTLEKNGIKMESWN